MTKISKMVQYVKDACNDSSVGYSQNHRWRNPDVDCSSLMYLAANAAGYNIKTGSGYTGTMLADFKKAGFTALEFDGNLNDLDPGDIMLNVEYHTEMYVGDGKFGGAHIDENGDVVGRKGGDQTGNEVSICDAYVYSEGWDYVLVPPKETTTTTKTTAAKTTKLSVDEIAKQVIAGKWGNGDARKKALKKAGYDYSKVQARVNQLLS